MSKKLENYEGILIRLIFYENGEMNDKICKTSVKIKKKFEIESNIQKIFEKTLSKLLTKKF